MKLDVVESFMDGVKRVADSIIPTEPEAKQAAGFTVHAASCRRKDPHTFRNAGQIPSQNPTPKVLVR
jgi:hypothetical protein